MHNLIVISIPPEPLRRTLSLLISELSHLTGSTTALAYPPHVTLRTGFKIPMEDNSLEKWEEGWTKHLKTLKPETLQLKEILFHPYQQDGKKKYFIGYSVVASERLLQFHHKLLAFSPFRKRNQTSFKPHLSLAYGDLEQEDFSKAKKWLGERMNDLGPQDSWQANAIEVYQEKQGKYLPLKTWSLK